MDRKERPAMAAETKDGLRVLLGGDCLRRRKSGIGYYTQGLLSGLCRAPEVAEVGVCSGARILPPESFLHAQRSDQSTARHDRLRRLVSTAAPFVSMWERRWRGARLARLVRKGNWSLYHEPNYIAPSLPLPTVITMYDLSFLKYPEFMRARRVALLRRVIPPALERAHAILTLTEHVRREVLDTWPRTDPARVRVTYAGVDPRFDASPADPARTAEVLSRHRLPPRFVLFLGTLEPRKNIQGILRAFGLLSPALQKSFPLVLGGMRGWREEHFAASLQDMRSRGVLFETGYVPHEDVPLLMKAAAAFCFPSFDEGFGLPPLEAAACGTPVVCSDRGALPEVMGDAAVYVDPGSPENIAAGLSRVLEDSALQRQLAAAGPRRAALFTWDRCIARTLAAYRLDDCHGV
jgi:alpha-1,3-rhamnosyl/mannosyltransferase